MRTFSFPENLSGFAFTLAIIFCFYLATAVSAEEPVLIGENSYESFVEGNYIVYTNFTDDPYNERPVDIYRYGVYKGRVLHGHGIPLSNIYLHNISSGETIPVYRSECKSTRPWILNGTICWFEDRSYQVFYKQGDPNPPGYYIYSVPVGNVSCKAADNYSLLNPEAVPFGNEKYNELILSIPNYTTDLVETVPEKGYYSMYYHSPKTGNRTRVAEGLFFEPYPPQIIGERIFWEDTRTGNPHLYVYDIKSEREYEVAPQVFAQYDCSVDGDIISWNTFSGDVYYSNFSGLIEEIPPEETQENSPKTTEAGVTLLIPAAALGAFLLTRKRR